MILIVRTDRSEAFIGLHDEAIVDEFSWQANKQLSDRLLLEIENLLKKNNLDWQGLIGIVFYRGPGSFTGLRIGATIANTLANSLSVPIIGISGDDWIERGVKKIHSSENDRIVIPEYGAQANITQPRK